MELEQHQTLQSELRKRSFVLFVLAKSRLALASDQSRFIVPLLPVHHVPGAPDFVYGAVRVRGETLPVVDVAERFRLPPVKLTERSHLLVAQAGPRSVALVVDDMPDFTAVETEDWDGTVEGLLPPGSEHWSRYLSGSLQHNNQAVPILSLERLLDTDEGRSLDGALDQYREGAQGE